MASPKPSVSWQHMRRLLASKSKNELLNLIRDLYALTTDNKDFVHAQVLTPKPSAPKTRQLKKPLSMTAKVSHKMREKPCPSHLDPEKWAHYKQVVDTALHAMQRYVEQPTTQTTNPLWTLQ